MGKQETINRVERLIGHVMVDSGQIMIGDPCYVREWKGDTFKDVREYIRIVDRAVVDTLSYPKDFTSYQDVIPKYGMTMNELLSEERGRKPMFEKVKRPPSGEYSYEGACQATLQTPYRGGQIGEGKAVCSSTGLGDGCYPVLATYTAEGRVAKVTITFMQGEDV